MFHGNIVSFLYQLCLLLLTVCCIILVTPFFLRFHRPRNLQFEYLNDGIRADESNNHFQTTLPPPTRTGNFMQFSRSDMEVIRLVTSALIYYQKRLNMFPVFHKRRARIESFS